MKKETDEADSLKEENEQLRQLLDMKSKVNATKLIASDVIMRTPATWKQSWQLMQVLNKAWQAICLL